MTQATTLKLPDELKSRIAAAAREAGKTPHAFMIDALTAQTEQAELRRSFIADALDAEREFAENGEAYDAEAAFGWLRAKLAGENPAKPAPIRLKPRR